MHVTDKGEHRCGELAGVWVLSRVPDLGSAVSPNERPLFDGLEKRTRYWLVPYIGILAT